MSFISGRSDSAARPRAHAKAPRGLELSCKGWEREAALRLLMNSRDEEVAGPVPDHVASCGSGGTARGVVRDEECVDIIGRSLRSLENGETLLVRSGRIVGVFPTQEAAPRVLVCNELEHRSGSAISGKPGQRHVPGILEYARMAAASWLYIGPQEFVQLLYEIFCAAAEQRIAARHTGAGQSTTENSSPERGPALAGKLIVSGGLGRLGGAQAVAATMAGAAFLGIEADPERIKQRLRSGQCDFMVNSLDEALRILKNAVRKGENLSVGLVGNCADVMPELAQRGVLPDILTDLSPAHERHGGYMPSGMNVREALELRARDLEAYAQRAREAKTRQVEAMLRLQSMGAVLLDLGNNVGSMALQQGAKIPGEVLGFAQLLRALASDGRGALRCIALSGVAGDIAVTDELALGIFPHDKRLRRWIELARQRLRFPGLPARIYRLGAGEQVELARAINRLVAERRIAAPVALGQDHLDFLGAASTEDDICGEGETAPIGMLMSGLLNTASGASLMSKDMGAAGLGYLQRMILADGSDAVANRIQRVLGNHAAFHSGALPTPGGLL